jgi:hypothetical protein
VPRLVLLVLVVLGAGACVSGSGEQLPPPPNIPTTTTTAVPDLSGVGLPPVPGKTTTTIAIGPGRATMGGTVVGPDGPVPGAVVHAERLVGESVAAVDVLTNADGTWQIKDVLGGRYRVRAWRVPDLALTQPQVFFLDGAEKKALNLSLARHQGMAATAAIAPNPPVVGSPANLVVQVTVRGVDERGVVRATPVSGVPIELFGAGDWRVTTPNPTSTDGGGRARWQLVCRRPGSQPLSVVVNDAESFPLSLPACTTPAAEEDGTAPATSTPASTTSSTTTTTTRPGGRP